VTGEDADGAATAAQEILAARDGRRREEAAAAALGAAGVVGRWMRRECGVVAAAAAAIVGEREETKRSEEETRVFGFGWLGRNGERGRREIYRGEWRRVGVRIGGLVAFFGAGGGGGEAKPSDWGLVGLLPEILCDN
jgi:hypothetical protein